MVFQLTPTETEQVAVLFAQMQEELASDYVHKYDLLRAYVLELLRCIAATLVANGETCLPISHPGPRSISTSPGGGRMARLNA